MSHARIGVFAITALAACGGSTETTGTGGATTTGSTSTTGSTTSVSTTSSSTSTSTTSSTNTGGTGTGGSNTGGTGTGGSNTGGTGPQGSPCHWNKTDPCGPGMYCDAIGCGDGTCKPTGATEQPARAPVCGCDGVTYWNVSVAGSHGMAVQANSACSPGKQCGGFAGLQCPAGSTCNYKVADKSECNISDQGGTCWAIPASCPPIVVGVMQHACQSNTCTDECNLIKLQTPWYDDAGCPQ